MITNINEFKSYLESIVTDEERAWVDFLEENSDQIKDDLPSFIHMAKTSGYPEVAVLDQIALAYDINLDTAKVMYDEQLNENADNVTFSILHRNDGIPSPYGKESNLNINDTIEALYYYDIINDNYSEEDLHKLLSDLKLNGTHTFGSSWSQIEVTKSALTSPQNENMYMPEDVELKSGVKYRDIKWDDLNIVTLEERDTYGFYSIQIPGENNKYNKGIIIDIKLEDGLTKLDIMMDMNLHGLGLGYKIYKKVIKHFGHIYSTFSKRVNDDAVPAIWNKLKKDSDIEVYSNKNGEIAIWKHIDDQLKDYFKKKIFNTNDNNN